MFQVETVLMATVNVPAKLASMPFDSAPSRWSALHRNMCDSGDLDAAYSALLAENGVISAGVGGVEGKFVAQHHRVPYTTGMSAVIRNIKDTDHRLQYIMTYVDRYVNRLDNDDDFTAMLVANAWTMIHYHSVTIMQNQNTTDDDASNFVRNDDNLPTVMLKKKPQWFSVGATRAYWTITCAAVVSFLHTGHHFGGVVTSGIRTGYGSRVYCMEAERATSVAVNWSDPDVRTAASSVMHIMPTDFVIAVLVIEFNKNAKVKITNYLKRIIMYDGKLPAVMRQISQRVGNWWCGARVVMGIDAAAGQMARAGLFPLMPKEFKAALNTVGKWITDHRADTMKVGELALYLTGEKIDLPDAEALDLAGIACAAYVRITNRSESMKASALVQKFGEDPRGAEWRSLLGRITAARATSADLGAGTSMYLKTMGMADSVDGMDSELSSAVAAGWLTQDQYDAQSAAVAAALADAAEKKKDKDGQ